MTIIILRKRNHNLSFIISHITYSFFTTFSHNTNYFIVQATNNCPFSCALQKNA